MSRTQADAGAHFERPGWRAHPKRRRVEVGASFESVGAGAPGQDLRGIAPRHPFLRLAPHDGRTRAASS